MMENLQSVTEPFGDNAHSPAAHVWPNATGVRHAHFIGIGGSGMRALAALMAADGWRISGSDASEDQMRELPRRHWQLVAERDAAGVLNGADVVIHSLAIDSNHTLRKLARRLGKPVFSYAQMLGRVLAGRKTLAVAGTHGKSTTTAMVASILVAAGLRPGVVCGAAPIDRPVTCGDPVRNGELAVVEACEFDASFLNLRPRAAVVTGIEMDHVDCYKTLGDVQSSFGRFMQCIDRSGTLFVPHNCSASRAEARQAVCAVRTFGLAKAADCQGSVLDANNGRYRIRIVTNDHRPAIVQLRVPGLHNVHNAVAAAALAWHAGAGSADIETGLSRFTGLKRRLEYRGSIDGVQVWDDYAHHPTAVHAALGAIRTIQPAARIWCVFQPHQASRTSYFIDEFAAALQLADRVAIAEIDRAREGPWRSGEITAADLAAAVHRRGINVLECHKPAEILQVLRLACCQGDVLVTLGAGNIGKLSHAFANRI